VSDASEIELADLSLAGSLRHFAEHAEGGTVEQRDGLLLFAGGHPYPGAYCNGVLRLDRATSAQATLEAARAFFAPRRRGYALWVRAHADRDLAVAAEERNFFERPPPGGMPGMVCTAPVEPPVVPAGASIEHVTDLRTAQRYLRVVAEAYGMEGLTPELAAGIFFTPRSALAENTVAVLATLGGRPAAGAMAIVLDGTAGLYWAATAPWARGRGLGAACARLATHAGFELGARTAALQASQLGSAMWSGLGFAEVTRYRRFLVPASGGGRA
jgi:acetyltransferase (GNAT) family protein